MPVSLEKVMDSLPARRRARIEARTAELITLETIRRSAAMTQSELAKQLGVGQDAVSRLERQPDMLVSTLRRYVESAGGKLELVVHLPGRRSALTLASPSASRKSSAASRTPRARRVAA